MCSKISILLPAALTLLPLLSCGRGEKAPEKEENVLVEVGDSALTLEAVLARIPSAISPEDSTEMFHRIVDGWVRRMVLQDVAEKNIPDLERVEEMVEEYRSNLIIQRYLASMEEKGSRDISDSRVKNYFLLHREEMKLESPLVKGLFIKVSDHDPQLDRLKKWVQTADAAALDNIEKHGLRHALQYDYFGQKWVDWNHIADQIPYRFFDADAFLEKTRDFETSYGGSTYLLHISEYIPSGREMPYDYAAERIAEILRTEDMAGYRSRLVSDIYRREMKEGSLKAGLYNPITGELKRTPEENKK